MVGCGQVGGDRAAEPQIGQLGVGVDSDQVHGAAAFRTHRVCHALHCESGPEETRRGGAPRMILHG